MFRETIMMHVFMGHGTSPSEAATPTPRRLFHGGKEEFSDTTV